LKKLYKSNNAFGAEEGIMCELSLILESQNEMKWLFITWNFCDY